MKHHIFIMLTFTLFLLFNSNVYCQKADSLKKSEQTIVIAKQDTITEATTSNQLDVDDDFAPGLFMMVMAMMVAALICIAIGAVAIIVVLMIVFGLISIGIVSASILVGIYQKSLESGFKTFIVLISSIGGSFLCAAVFFVICKLTELYTIKIAILSGAAIGLALGCVFGFLAFWIIQKLTYYLKKRLNLT